LDKVIENLGFSKRGSDRSPRSFRQGARDRVSVAADQDRDRALTNNVDIFNIAVIGSGHRSTGSSQWLRDRRLLTIAINGIAASAQKRLPRRTASQSEID
jgi:hypothetical protein